MESIYGPIDEFDEFIKQFPRNVQILLHLRRNYKIYVEYPHNVYVDVDEMIDQNIKIPTDNVDEMIDKYIKNPTDNMELVINNILLHCLILSSNRKKYENYLIRYIILSKEQLNYFIHKNYMFASNNFLTTKILDPIMWTETMYKIWLIKQIPIIDDVNKLFMINLICIHEPVFTKNAFNYCCNVWNNR